MRNFILFACLFCFLTPAFAEFKSSELLEKIQTNRAEIYSSLDLSAEQTDKINELDKMFYEKLSPHLLEMNNLSHKLETIANSGDCTVKKVKSVKKEFKVVEHNLNLLKKDYEKQMSGILSAEQSAEYRVLKKKQQQAMRDRMKEEIDAIRQEQRSL